jgi:hypothetical protein
MYKDIIFISTDDFANVGTTFAIACRKVGLDCLSVVTGHHRFKYVEKGLKWSNRYPGELQSLADDFRVVIMMHSELFNIEKRSWQRWGVFHGGGRYRDHKNKCIELFNPVMDITFCQDNDLLGFGGVNERWLMPAVDTDYLQPLFSDLDTLKDKGIRFRHHPNRPDLKGSKAINSIMDEYKDRCSYIYDENLLPWFENMKRLGDCDVYIESFGPFGEWGGVTLLEAAALGKVNICQLNGRAKYEKEFGCQCPVVSVTTEATLYDKVGKLIGSPETIIDIQRKTRNWVVNTHGYVPTGLRIKQHLEL